MFSRIVVMFRNIHLGGAFSGIRSIICSKSKPPQLRVARRQERDAKDGSTQHH